MELTTSDDPGGDIQALRERLSTLSEASLRICESLDVDTVLREVVESARALTGAAAAGSRPSTRRDTCRISSRPA